MSSHCRGLQFKIPTLQTPTWTTTLTIRNRFSPLSPHTRAQTHFKTNSVDSAFSRWVIKLKKHLWKFGRTWNTCRNVVLYKSNVIVLFLGMHCRSNLSSLSVWVLFVLTNYSTTVLKWRMRKRNKLSTNITGSFRTTLKRYLKGGTRRDLKKVILPIPTLFQDGSLILFTLN